MEILIPAERIQQRVAELAKQVQAAYENRPLTAIGVLTGSLIFLADLIRHIDLPLRIGLIQASSYRGETTAPGALQIGAYIPCEVRGRHVLVVDDILDTGRTLEKIIAILEAEEPASLRVAVLLRKRGRQEIALEPDFCGFEIPDVYVVGYGLDYDDEYRHLPHVAVLPES